LLGYSEEAPAGEKKKDALQASLLTLLVQTYSIYLLAYSEEAPAAGKKKDALQAKTMMLLRASDRWCSMYSFYLIDLLVQKHKNWRRRRCSARV
jgi:hypothetical protein